jgi:TIGR03009 family protein
MNSSPPLRFVVIALSLLLASPAWGQQSGPPANGARVARNVAPAAARPAAANPMQPSWVPLNPAHQQHVDQVLAYWEARSNKVKRYRCKFRRWVYDPVFGPKSEVDSYSEGVIKYVAPDKGLFRVETMKKYTPGRGGAPAEYKTVTDDRQFDHWICDGRWVYRFDHEQKKLVQIELPPEMRGKSIGKGPLPFLFNAKADDIKRRFWIQTLTPKGVQDEYHLEAFPKTAEDANQFKKIHLILDRADYLPKAMVVYDTNFAPALPSRTTYEFSDREVNFNILAEKLNLFHREFFEPAVPRGWEKQVIKHNPNALPGAATTARNPAAAAAPK